MSTRALAVVAATAMGCFALIAVVGNGALARAVSANEQHRYSVAQSEAKLAHEWMPWSPDPLLALGEAQLQRGDLSGAAASFNHAISLDRGDWRAWLDFAATLKGPAQKRAIAQAHALYPRSPEIVRFEYEVSVSSS
jgi:Flp pilus assembly protein TadD